MREVPATGVLDIPEVTDYISQWANGCCRWRTIRRRDHVLMVRRQHQRLRHGRRPLFITRAAVLTRTKSELAGVMAHELSHILQKHQARMIRDASRGAVDIARRAGPRSPRVALQLRLRSGSDGSRARRRHGL